MQAAATPPSGDGEALLLLVGGVDVEGRDDAGVPVEALDSRASILRRAVSSLA